MSQVNVFGASLVFLMIGCSSFESRSTDQTFSGEANIGATDSQESASIGAGDWGDGISIDGDVIVVNVPVGELYLFCQQTEASSAESSTMYCKVSEGGLDALDPVTTSDLTWAAASNVSGVAISQSSPAPEPWDVEITATGSSTVEMMYAFDQIAISAEFNDVNLDPRSISEPKKILIGDDCREDHLGIDIMPGNGDARLGGNNVSAASGGGGRYVILKDSMANVAGNNLTVHIDENSRVNHNGNGSLVIMGKDATYENQDAPSKIYSHPMSTINNNSDEIFRFTTSMAVCP